MREIFIPLLKSITINNYSLYKQEPTFTYNFITGVNLIIGVNGIGKTTFISLIKYGLIGGYKKDSEIKIYKYQKRVNRRQLNNDFFRQRMDIDYPYNENAHICLTFQIGNMVVRVKRLLFNLMLDEVYVEDTSCGKGYFMKGTKIRQDKYEKLSEDDKKETMFYNYEEFIKDNVKLYSYDDFIFFVNEILSFGENRKTILWDWEIQERLSNKYFNDLGLDQKYEEAKNEEKYYGSIAKHKSEEIKAINRIIPKDSNIPSEKNYNKVKEIKTKIEKSQSLINKTHLERTEKQNEYKLLKYQRDEILKIISDLEIQLGALKLKNYEIVWQAMNPLYDTMFQNIKQNKICPMCNKDISDELYKTIIENDDRCFLCASKINAAENSNNKQLEVLEIEVATNYQRKNVIESRIYNCEQELLELDKEFSNQESILFNLKVELRDIEFSRTKNSTSEDISIQLIQERVKKLQEEKEYNLKISFKHKTQKEEIVKRMDEERRRTNLVLSDSFSQYAGAFLGTNAELTYDVDEEGNKMYLPIIGGKIRMDYDQLSESQCFFVDFSFRLSILNYFYTGPSFFSCETPEGSLDASYEANAADVFLHFLERPNVLILTTNLNNSDFLRYIANKAPHISYINLLRYGNLSSVQASNDNIKELSMKVEDVINGKNKFVIN